MTDQSLLARTASLIGRDGEPFCVALVEGDEVRTAVRGMERDADVEIGSISKGITGLLLHDAIGRGEVTMESRLGEFLSAPSESVGEVTLGSLATHTAGLPRIAPGGEVMRKTWRMLAHAENPYGETLETLLASLRGVRPKGNRPSYSNLGFMLLGHALASAADQRYAALVHSRIAAPLALPTLYAAETPASLRPQALLGSNRMGKQAEAWTGEAVGPAGGIRATVDDLALLVAALLDGSAPGVAALDPVRNFAGRGVQIGAAWLTLEVKGRPVVWHNGGTGGFRSYLGLDRAAGRGVALVRASTRSADRAGFELVGGD